MTRITLDIDPFVLELLRERAKVERKTMGQLASELLAASFREPPLTDLQPLNWIRKPMGKPLIDIEDKEVLWQFLDGESDDARDKP